MIFKREEIARDILSPFKEEIMSTANLVDYRDLLREKMGVHAKEASRLVTLFQYEELHKLYKKEEYSSPFEKKEPDVDWDCGYILVEPILIEKIDDKRIRLTYPSGV